MVDEKTDEANLERSTKSTKTDDLNALKIQYDRLASDWRHYTTIIWGIPSVAVAIMSGILIASYGSELEGWPRIASLSIGSLFLFALTIEVVKKRHDINVVTYVLKDLQKEILQDENLHLPLGMDEDLKRYVENKGDFEKKFGRDYKDPIFELFRRSYAKASLTWVVFGGAIIMAILAELEFFRYTNIHGKEWAVFVTIVLGIIAFIAPLVIYRVKEKSRQKK